MFFFKIISYFITIPITKFFFIIKYNLLRFNKSYLKKNHKIIIPWNSYINEFSKMPRFNKFIFFLSKNLPNNSEVIDVGANIGDTTIEILIANHTLSVIAIDGDITYHKYLKININNIQKKIHNKIKVKTFLNYIGNNVKGGLVNDNTGSSHYTNKGNNKFIKLDDLIKNISNVSFIKIDTDGYDYDVISSSKNIISNFQPILFFEAACINKKILMSYIKTTKYLNKLGYTNFSAFDNCGSLILQNVEPKIINELYEYTNRQHNGKQYGIPYFDVLAYTPRYNNVVKKSLKQFVKFSNKKI